MMIDIDSIIITAFVISAILKSIHQFIFFITKKELQARDWFDTEESYPFLVYVRYGTYFFFLLSLGFVIIKFIPI